ncbi:MAG: bifunctional 3-deoxy-7-phosphoheptulonate synthase/chorismate mutase type II [Planctomycetaceae bacterium]|jgi:chorismate mutase|nr:bifunctional 3-deoxy-7-phosphoheptulonate synthase/chorismate mutase type II [Planctomycetaceae bacterium]
MELQLESIVLPGIDPVCPLMIAGPCSAETEEQVVSTAVELASVGVRIFRAGIWKPRTKPGGFEGIGSEGLGWLKRVKRETGMYTTIEVATRNHVFDALKAGIDILWMGARTVVNPFAVQEIADSLSGMDVPVLIKNPVNPDLELWIGAIERIYRAGIRRIGAVHRGFSSYENKGYRNTPHWQIPIELRRRIPNLPILCDPSHIAGNRELIHSLAQQAMDLKFDGLLIEVHCSPDKAWSDAKQQITPKQLKQLLDTLIIRDTDHPSEDLADLRNKIDGIDDQLLSLLASRMQVAEEIGRYKKANNMPVLQTTRYGQIIEQKSEMAKSMKLNPDFIKEIMKQIHEESVRRQMDIMNINQTENSK